MSMSIERLQVVFAVTILVTVVAMHVFSALVPRFTVPGALDDVLLIVAGALFSPLVLRRGRTNDVD